MLLLRAGPGETSGQARTDKLAETVSNGRQEAGRTRKEVVGEDGRDWRERSWARDSPRGESRPTVLEGVSAYGAGTATRLAGTICGWKAKTSRLRASTRTFTQFTSLVPLAALSPKVCRRVKFSRRRPCASNSGLSRRKVWVSPCT